MVHTRAMATGVAIIGRMNTVRASPRKAKRWLKHTAANTPSTVGRITASTVKYSVRAIAHKKRSSSAMRR